MERITVSAKGQIAIPKAIREQLGLDEGTRLDLNVDGSTITLTKSQDWRTLYGAAAATDLLDRYEENKLEERKRENEGEVRLLLSAINAGETYYALAKLSSITLDWRLSSGDCFRICR